jgi:hypothetical protein
LRTEKQGVCDSCGKAIPLCANISETSSPSTITVGRGKKSRFDNHKQDKQFSRCVGSFTAEYKRSILDQADAAQDSGSIGALLRREGLYSSHLTTWKRQRQKGEIDALTPQKRGPKVVVSPLVKQNRQLQAANARLTNKLQYAELIIAAQKKVAALLGNSIPNIQIDEEN